MADATMDASFPKLIEGVTPEDLRRVASRYMAADLASYSVVRPEGTTGPSRRTWTPCSRPGAPGGRLLRPPGARA
jgi:hypothetical protein